MAGVGGDGGRVRTDQGFDERAKERRRRQVRVLVGKAPGIESAPDQPFQFGGERPAIGGTRAVDLGLEMTNVHG